MKYYSDYVEFHPSIHLKLGLVFIDQDLREKINIAMDKDPYRAFEIIKQHSAIKWGLE